MNLISIFISKLWNMFSKLWKLHFKQGAKNFWKMEIFVYHSIFKFFKSCTYYKNQSKALVNQIELKKNTFTVHGRPAAAAKECRWNIFRHTQKKHGENYGFTWRLFCLLHCCFTLMQSRQFLCTSVSNVLEFPGKGQTQFCTDLNGR